MPVYFRETITEPHKQTFYEHSQEEQVVVNRRPLSAQEQQQAVNVQQQTVPPGYSHVISQLQTQQRPQSYTQQLQPPQVKQFPVQQQQFQQAPRPPQIQVTTQDLQNSQQQYQAQQPQFQPQQQQVEVPVQTTQNVYQYQTLQQPRQQQTSQQYPPQIARNVLSHQQQPSMQSTTQQQVSQSWQSQTPQKVEQPTTNIQSVTIVRSSPVQGEPVTNRYEEYLKQQLNRYPHQDDELGDFKFEVTARSPKQPVIQDPQQQQQQPPQGIQYQQQQQQQYGVRLTQQPPVVQYQQTQQQQQYSVGGQPPSQVPSVEQQQSVHEAPPVQQQQQYNGVQTIQYQQQVQPQQQQQQPVRGLQNSQQQQSTIFLQKGTPQPAVQPVVPEKPQLQHTNILVQQQPMSPMKKPHEQPSIVFDQQRLQQQKPVAQPSEKGQDGVPKHQGIEINVQCESGISSALASPQSQPTNFQPMSFQQQPVVGYQQQQAKYQPPDPIVQVDYRSNNAYPLQPNGVQQHPIDQQQQYPEALFRRWIPGDERQDYYMDIPTGPPPTFTSLGTFDDPVLVGEPYARRVSLDRRRAENHSPVPGAAEHGYLFGGMDYIDHLRFDPNQTVEVPIDPDVRRARSVDDRGPQRPPNDYYGLNYLTLAPADRPRDYAPEDQQAIYHGYQALSPRKQPKVTADPNAPLNIAEVSNLDSYESDKLIGNTLSNQRIQTFRELTEEEKNRFCLEFGPPEGFKPEHRTVPRKEQKPEDPVCFSTSLMKRNVADKPQEQEQQQVNVTVNPFKSDADSGWYLRYKGKPDGMVSIVSDKHPAWDSKTYLPSWAKVPPQPQPSWVRRSNTVHNVWQTPSAGDRGGFVAAPVNYLTDYQQQQTLLSDGDPQQPSMNEGDEMGKLVISTDNVILPNVAQSPDVAIIKAKNTGEKQLDPPVVITRNPFAAVEPIFSRDREGKSVHVHFSPGAKGQPSVQQGVQQPIEQQQQNGTVEGALV